MQLIVTNTSTYSCGQSIVFYNMVGNFIPPEWKNLSDSSGKTLSKTARQLLSLIVYHMQPSTGEELKELQESYYFFESALGVGQRRVRQCLSELQQAGFITLYSTTIIKHHIKCRNTLCIKLAKKFQPYMKEISSEPEKSFNQVRKDFQAHNIIDNNISNLEYRYRSSNFVDKNLENSTNDISQTTEPAHEDKKIQQGTTKRENKPDTGIFEGIANKAKKWLSGKKLEEFHPLSEDDAYILQTRSKRGFSLSYMNKLLMRLSDKYSDHKFHSKSAMMNYMTKALANEMRQAQAVNNETFNFKADNELTKQEKYLNQVENSAGNDRPAQLHRKIAGVFDRKTAYLLLTNCYGLISKTHWLAFVGNNGLKLIDPVVLSWLTLRDAETSLARIH